MFQVTSKFQDHHWWILGRQTQFSRTRPRMVDTRVYVCDLFLRVLSIEFLLFRPAKTRTPKSKPGIQRASSNPCKSKSGFPHRLVRTIPSSTRVVCFFHFARAQAKRSSRRCKLSRRCFSRLALSAATWRVVFCGNSRFLRGSQNSSFAVVSCSRKLKASSWSLLTPCKTCLTLRGSSGKPLDFPKS